MVEGCKQPFDEMVETEIRNDPGGFVGERNVSVSITRFPLIFLHSAVVLGILLSLAIIEGGWEVF